MHAKRGAPLYRFTGLAGHSMHFARSGSIMGRLASSWIQLGSLLFVCFLPVGAIKEGLEICRTGFYVVRENQRRFATCCLWYPNEEILISGLVIIARQSPACMTK